MTQPTWTVAGNPDYESISTDAYDSDWNGSAFAPTQNAVYDKIELMDANITAATLPVVDTTEIVKGSVDATKKVRIEADGLTTGTTRVITMPDTDVDLGGVADGVAAKLVTDEFDISSQTENQHLKSDGTDFKNVSYYNPVVVSLTDGATIDINASQGNLFKVTLGGDRTINAPTNAVDGQMMILRVTQDATGTRLITWNAIFDFGGAGEPTLSTTASKTDYVNFRYNSDNTKWDYMGTGLLYG